MRLKGWKNSLVLSLSLLITTSVYAGEKWIEGREYVSLDVAEFETLDADPGAPSLNYGNLYSKLNDGIEKLYWQDSTGTASEISFLGSSIPLGAVIFSDGSKLTSDVSNLYWDDTNDRLGIGTTSPSGRLHVEGTGNIIFNQSGNVGIGTTSPNSKLEIAGPIATAITTKTGAYTITASDSTILCDASGAAFTVTLPAVANTSGRIYTIKKIDSSANAITIDGNASETIDDALTYSLSSQYKYVTIQSDGSEWWIVSQN